MEKTIDNIFSGFHGDRNELIPVLQEVQDSAGYLSEESMRAVAEFLNVPESAVFGTVSFYSQFHLTPQGRHKIKVCQGTACHVRGSDAIVEALKDCLGIAPGETTEDCEFSLERVACFGSCALAPVMVVDDKVYGNVTPEQAKQIVEGVS